MENRFLVPQHIETEPKILGPVTVRQFLEMLSISIVDFAIWKLMGPANEVGAIALIVTLTTIMGIIAFTTINGQGFHYFLLNIFRTLKRPRLKVWKKQVITYVEEEMPHALPPTPHKSLPGRSHLSDLTLLVDTGGAYSVGKEIITQDGANVEELKI